MFQLCCALYSDQLFWSERCEIRVKLNFKFLKISKMMCALMQTSNLQRNPRVWCSCAYA